MCFMYGVKRLGARNYGNGRLSVCFSPYGVYCIRVGKDHNFACSYREFLSVCTYIDFVILS